MIKSERKAECDKISMKRSPEIPARLAESELNQSQLHRDDFLLLTKRNRISQSSDLNAVDGLQHQIHLCSVSGFADEERVLAHRLEARLAVVEELFVASRQKHQLALLGL